jgi:RNA-directed DNA polymerase
MAHSGKLFRARSLATTPDADLMQVANSYFGLLRQASASHHDRAQLANVVRARGRAVDGALTKTYRGRPE